MQAARFMEVGRIEVGGVPDPKPARGEVVVIDEEFGIRITEVIGHEQKPHGTAAP